MQNKKFNFSKEEKLSLRCSNYFLHILFNSTSTSVQSHLKFLKCQNVFFLFFSFFYYNNDELLKIWIECLNSGLTTGIFLENDTGWRLLWSLYDVPSWKSCWCCVWGIVTTARHSIHRFMDPLNAKTGHNSTESCRYLVNRPASCHG